MFRIRFHGRGGQGMKTASQILGRAFFNAGFQVQDAPRYGAERRGAPVFAYVRADTAPILERGIIARPDLVMVADDTLVAVAAAGVLQGVTAQSVLVINSAELASAWKDRLKFPGPVLNLPLTAAGVTDPEHAFAGAACAGAAARLSGVISPQQLVASVRLELGAYPPTTLESNVAQALGAYDAMARHAGLIVATKPADFAPDEAPDWIELALDNAPQAAPDVLAGVTSERQMTGLWRVMRPVIDSERCNRCSWICSTLCPDSAIKVGDDHAPSIDYDHCKGCLVCVSVCPPHAIHAVAERDAVAEGTRS